MSKRNLRILTNNLLVNWDKEIEIIKPRKRKKTDKIPRPINLNKDYYLLR